MSTTELAQLVILNMRDMDDVARFIEESLHCTFADVMDEKALSYLNEVQWTSHCEWSKEQDLWMATEEWRKLSGHSGDAYKCQFALEASGEGDGTDQYWLTQALGVGERNLGFRWWRNDVRRKSWRRAVGEQVTIVDNLRALGFEFEDWDGSFFLSFRLDQQEASDAVGNESPELALTPFTHCLKTCVEAKPFFDKLLDITDAQF